jgi:hypothetical protein
MKRQECTIQLGQLMWVKSDFNTHTIYLVLTMLQILFGLLFAALKYFAKFHIQLYYIKETSYINY